MPFNWRGFYDFGSSLIGDWGVHILGPANWGLFLSPENLVSVECIKKDPLPPTTFPDVFTIKYEFKASTSVPGLLGLFRTVVETGASEELAAPFDNSSRFRFYILSNTGAVNEAPDDLSTLRGIELQMNGLSEKIPSGSLARTTAPFRTAVFFKNRLD